MPRTKQKQEDIPVAETGSSVVASPSLDAAIADDKQKTEAVPEWFEAAAVGRFHTSILACLSEPRYAAAVAQHLERRTYMVLEELTRLVASGAVVHLDWGRYLRADLAEGLGERPAPMQLGYRLDEAILALLTEPRSVGDLSYWLERPQKEVRQFLLGMKRSRLVVFTGPNRIERPDVPLVRNRAVAALAGPVLAPDLKEQVRLFLETPRRMDRLVSFVSAGQKKAYRLLEALNEAGLLLSPEFGVFQVRSRPARKAVMPAVFSQASYLAYMGTPRNLKDMRRVFGFSQIEAYNHLRRDVRRRLITRAKAGQFHHVGLPDAPPIKPRFLTVAVEFD